MGDYQRFETWFRKRWPDFEYPIGSAYEIWKAATLAERERCAQVAEHCHELHLDSFGAAEVIRARGSD